MLKSPYKFFNVQSIYNENYHKEYQKTFFNYYLTNYKTVSYVKIILKSELILLFIQF